MPPTIKNIAKEELKKLVFQRDELERKIKALEATISAYSPKSASVGHFKGSGDPQIIELTKRVFLENHNQPLQVRDVVMRIVQLESQFDEKTVNNKMFALLRNEILEKVTYGKYIYKGLVTEKEPRFDDHDDK